MAQFVTPMSLTAPSTRQANPFNQAVDAWYRSESDRFEFAVLATSVVGNYEPGKTQELADKIKRSPTTVQNYAKVGFLWLAMVEKYPAEAETFRDELQTSYWLPVARQWANGEMTLDGVKSWFELCVKKGWTVEQFRTQLPTSEGTSEMVKSVKQFVAWVDRGMAFIESELIHAPAFDVNPMYYKQFIRILKMAKDLAEKVVKK